MGDQGSAFEWRRRRDRVDRLVERGEDAPYNLFTRRGLVTNSAKRKVYEEGIQGQQNVARFRVRAELQRVPSGAEALLAPGSVLKVGYARRKSNRNVAVDWPGSTGGRYA